VYTHFQIIVNDLVHDQSRELTKKAHNESRMALITDDSIKRRREPVGGLASLRKLIGDDVKKIQSLLRKSSQRPLSIQKHNYLLGFLLSFICTEMPQVLFTSIHRHFMNVNFNLRDESRQSQIYEGVNSICL